MTIYIPLELVIWCGSLVLVALSTHLLASLLTRGRVSLSWRATLVLTIAIWGFVVSGYVLAHAAPPDADFQSGGYSYDASRFLDEDCFGSPPVSCAVVTSQGYTITPVAFADSLNKIIMCESGNNPEAVNLDGGATGLLQLYPDSAMLRHVREHGYSWADVQDPFVNLWLGYRWWLRTGGWRQWECRA